MQFKHPELLYALLLLVIPIIVHLFQLRKFQKEAFTNVAFLKKVNLQTRKSSQLKKWLTLLTRLLLLAAIIIVFAQPYTALTENYLTKSETVIYLDNSYSMQAKGTHGELLKRAVQDIISSIPEDQDISLITNTQTFKNKSIKSIKNDLLQLAYVPNQLTYDAALLKSKKLFSNTPNSVKNLVFISDFQQKENAFEMKTDSVTKYNLVKLQPVNINNVFLDSLYISQNTPSNLELTVVIKNTGETVENLPVSLYNGKNLLGKTTVNVTKEAQTTFSLPTNIVINGTITINDTGLQFDNSLFFSINDASKINVLAINEANDNFLKRIYTADEFNFIASTLEQLDYNIIDQQNLIVLNELHNVPASLSTVLKSFTDNDGYVLIIPSNQIQRQSYNSLLLNYGLNFNDPLDTEKYITTINYAHPLYNNGVFEKQVSNFQYPKANRFYEISSRSASTALNFEDGKAFLSQSGSTYLFSSPLNEDNSNFKNSPLIVPSLYNIGKMSLKTPRLYYTIGRKNTYDVEVKLQQDHILSIVSESTNIIPQQQYFNNKIAIATTEIPDIANVYSINNGQDIIKYISYNFNREESNLVYQNLSINQSNVTIGDTITDTFETLKSNGKVNELWKWFVIFALLFLIIEMLILKYFK